MSMLPLRYSNTFSRFPARAARRKELAPSDWSSPREEVEAIDVSMFDHDLNKKAINKRER